MHAFDRIACIDISATDMVKRFTVDKPLLKLDCTLGEGESSGWSSVQRGKLARESNRPLLDGSPDDRFRPALPYADN